MRNFDFSPLFRSTVGFDNMSRLLDAATRSAETADGYPPYNIEKLGDDDYRITVAVAGFGPEDLEITQKESSLVIQGRAAPEEGERTYLHRGIAGRAFERSFQLADHIRVVGADLQNGLLVVTLKREVPEALKPRTIEIGTAPKARSLGNKAA